MGASNTTIYAHWDANPVYITYLGNGADGGSTPKQTCYYNQTCTLSTNGFTYTGHSWTGWYPSAKGGTRFGDTVKLTADLKVYAQWELSKYKLSYDGNGHNSGSTADTECQYNVDCQLRSNGYDKIGHNFAGWYNARTGGTPYGTYTKLKNNLTVYAHWNPKPYSVTYNGNTNTGGSTSPTTCNYNKPCSLATNGFSKTGHSWNGWWTAAGGGTRYPASVTITGNITAYAHWKKNSYTLTYVPSGLCNPGSKTLEYDEAYGTLCTPTMTGYTFTGWYTAETGGTRVGSNNKMGASNTKIYAHLSVNPVTVTYKGNGNTGGSMTNQTCYYNQNCTLKTNGFTNTGKSWTGWYSSATGGTKFGATVKLTGNLTVYAQWKANNYTLTYSPSGLCNPGSKTVAFGSTYGTLCAPTQTGYTFGGWWTAASGGTQVSANTKMGAANTTIYAHKQAVSYSITYSLNGGSVTGNPTTYNIETNAFTLKNPSRTGYIFDGWSGTGISGKSKSVTIPKGSTGNRSYTAHWLSDKITLKIKLYSGDKIKSETTTGGTTNKWSKNSSGYLLQNGSVYTATFPRSTASKFNPANHRNHHFIFLTKNGYGADYHKAWVCDSGCKGTVYFSDGPMTINTYNIIADDNIEGNIVLKVNWRTAKSIVMYNINGGTVLNLPEGYYVDADGWIYNDVKGGSYDDIGSPYLHTLNSNEALSQNGVINYGWPTFINIAPPPGKTGPDHASAWARMDHNSIYTCKRTTYSEASNTGYTGSSFCDTTRDGDCICRLKVNW